MRTKSFDAAVTSVKADPGNANSGQGTFEALVSVFGNVDSYGDRMVKGAFANTLSEWAAKGDPIPVVWSHQWPDPHAIIGSVTSAEETDQGLVVKGNLLLGIGTYADVVYELMSRRLITQFSFGFDILDGAETKTDGQSVFDIREVKLYEVGPCLLGVNQSTDLLDIKAGQAKAIDGEEATTVADVLEQLTEIVDKLTAIAPAEEDDAEAGKSSVPPNAGDAMQAQTAARLNLITAGGE